MYLGMDCPLRVGVVGINFKTANLSFREAIARSAKKLTGEAGLFFPHPAIVLSTCNRCEIYFTSSDLAEAQTDLIRFLYRETGIDFEHRIYSYFGIHCLTHLCRVASGLDSAIALETEIQGQVKSAYISHSKVSLPSELHFLFQKALHVGKKIRTIAPSVHGGRAIFHVIESLIRQAGIDLALAKILFIGNSEINRSLIRCLVKPGMRRAHLCTLHPRKDEILEVYGREVLAFWERYDLIFSASHSAEHLIRPPGRVKNCMIFDLGVPRNVDPRVAKLPGVRLFNIDQLDASLQDSKGCELDLFNLEEMVCSHAQRLCGAYRKKQRYLSVSSQ